jgi:hypothetical protein
MDVENSLESNGFHLINIFLKGIKFNTNHCLTDVLVPLQEWRRTQVGAKDRKLIVYADTALPRAARVTLEFLRQNGMKKRAHSPCSLDLALFNFYLLSLISSAVTHILEGIEKVTFDRIFLT